MSHEQPRPLCAQGNSGNFNKVPVELSKYYAAEADCGPPLGPCAVRDPRLEAAARRMHWPDTLAHQVGFVGTIHHHLATLSGPTWVEPSAALSSTVKELNCTAVNGDSRWPRSDSEQSYHGETHLKPQAASTPSDAVWTDGSRRLVVLQQLPLRRNFFAQSSGLASKPNVNWLLCRWWSTFTLLQAWSGQIR